MTEPTRIDAALAARRKGRGERPAPRPRTDLGLTPADTEAAQVAARMPVWHELIPHKYLNARLSDWEGVPLRLATTWQDDPFTVGTNMVISGPVGVGKTHLGIGALRPLFFGGASICVVTAKQLLAMIDHRNEDSSANRRHLYRVDVLQVDDLGTVSEHDWVVGELTALLDERYGHDLPTIATTNLVPDDLKVAIGERAYSRLTGAAVGIKLTGDDRRKTKKGPS